jgi:branched-chain amino acid transport system substrate-binding protein
MHDSSRRSSLKKIAAGLGAAAMGPRVAFAQQEPVRIAISYALSGPAGSPGNAVLMGAKIAAEQWNRQGGVLGRKVEIIARDDKASPAESALIGREMFGSGVKFIVGGQLTAQATAMLNLLAENEGVFLAAGSSSMSFTHELFNPRAFRVSPNTRMNLFAAAKAMAENRPDISIWGGLTPDSQFGTDNYHMFGVGLKKYYKEIARKDIQVLDPVLAPYPATDFKILISRLMATPAQAAYLGIFGQDLVTFMSQGRQLGLFNKVKLFMDAGQGVGAARMLGTQMPPELWSPTPWFPDAKNGNAVTKGMIKDYAAMTGDKGVPDSSLFYGYTSVSALLVAMRNAKSLEPAVVRVGLERLAFEAPNGPFRFRPEDHQGISGVQVLRMVPKASDPPWDITKVVNVRGDDVIEPPGPGKTYVNEG